MSEMENMTFEQALAELEASIARLEQDDLTLKESLAVYERGQKLAQFCHQMLENAALRVAMLTADGEEEAISLE